MRSIELENFQSLRDSSIVPIRRVTLLFGPNSAGKSAVYDAIGLFKDFWHGRLPERREWASWLHKKPSGKAEADSFSIAISFDRDEFFRVAFPRHRLSTFRIWSAGTDVLPRETTEENRLEDHRLRPSLASGEIKIRLEFSQDAIAGISIEAEDRWLMRFKHLRYTDGEVAINLRHRFMKRVGFSEKSLKAIIGNQEKASKKSPKGVVPVSIRNGAIRYEVSIPPRVQTPRDLKRVGVKRNAPMALVKELSEPFDWIWDWVTGNLTDHMPYSRLPTHVPATRPVPEDADLCFVVPGLWLEDVEPDDDAGEVTTVYANPHYAAFKEAGVDRGLHERLAPRTDFTCFEKLAVFHTYSELCRQAQETLRKRVELSSLDDEEPFSGKPKSFSWRDQQLSLVNQCLADDLFLETAYQIHIDVRRLVPSGDLVADPPILDFYDAMKLSSVSTISLRDVHDRHVGLQNVGSGISNVLPLLVEMITSREVFVEQPELHLHPALQSAMGDAILKLTHETTLIAETHSEHLLLRLLRRLRESTEGRHEKDLLRLTSDDLSVIYFNPQVDGATTCKELRISPHGEFIDRWPRGFFDERYGDLFDE